MSSSLELAEVHSLFGFKITKISAISIGIGSVGISATPIRLTIFSTSGNFALTIFSIFVVVSIVSVNELPGFKIA